MTRTPICLVIIINGKPGTIKITERGKQIVHLQTNIILLGLKKAIDITLNFNNRGPLQGVLLINIQGRGVYTK